MSRYRGERLLLRNIHLGLSPGRLTLLQGPNGAGKTTLWMIMGGLLMPDKGHVLWQGKRIRRQDWSLVYRHVGLAGTEPFLHQDLTGQQNLVFWARACGLSGGREADRWLQQVGLQREGDLPVRRYSLGQKKRLGLARAFLSEPTVLLLDEPFSSLDRDGQRLLLALLHQHRARGGSALVVQHEAPPDLAADEIYRLEGGILHREGRP
ncbi:MAG: heme ABC exporter ATP-binding protein CcmA [Bacillota bacterium]|nr:heme ABC exporter ATP-binding protein CcmA [Bacillota bacterium]